MGGIFRIIYIHQGMHQNWMTRVILKIKFKHYHKTYKNWLLRKYKVVLKCGVYNIGHWLSMLHNWQNIEDGY
jgi:CCR4-NOT transcriptional regulation complex NOT5 subunit